MKWLDPWVQPFLRSISVIDSYHNKFYNSRYKQNKSMLKRAAYELIIVQYIFYILIGILALVLWSMKNEKDIEKDYKEV